MQFDAIESGRVGVARGVPVILDDPGNLRCVERARRDKGLHAIHRHRLAPRRYR